MQSDVAPRRLRLGRPPRRRAKRAARPSSYAMGPLGGLAHCRICHAPKHWHQHGRGAESRDLAESYCRFRLHIVSPLPPPAPHHLSNLMANPCAEDEQRKLRWRKAECHASNAADHGKHRYRGVCASPSARYVRFPMRGGGGVHLTGSGGSQELQPSTIQPCPHSINDVLCQ